MNEGKQKHSTGSVYAKHHTKRQALQELGSNILNSIKLKLPRNRKVELNI